MLVPTTCFNCESACGLLAYVDKDDLSIKKVEGNPAHPGSRGRNCAKGPATINQVNDPERILHPLRRAGERGGGQWERVSWDEALDDIAGRIRQAIVEGRRDEVVYHVGRPGRGRLRRAVAAGLGGRRAQQPHQHVLVRRAAGPDAVGRLRPAVPRPRQRQGHPAALQPPRDRALLQPARPADHGGQAGRAPSSSWSTRGCPTLHRTPTCGSPRGRAARPPSFWPSPPTCCAPAGSTSRSCAAGSTGTYLESRHPEQRRGLRGVSRRARGGLRRVHLRVRRRGGPGARGRRSRARPARRRCRRSARGPRLALRRGGNLGGWQVARALLFLGV